MTPWSFFNRVKLNSLIANKSQGVLRALDGLLASPREEFFADKGIDVTKEKTFANDKAAVEPAVAQTSERDQDTPAGAAGPQNAGPTGHALGQNSPLDAARAGNPAALRGIHSMGPGAAMAALHPQVTADKSGQSGQQTAPVYEPIDPGITAQFKAATGEDVAEVLIAENPELEKEGKRGVALAGECIEVLPGMKSDAKLCTHELVHVVQQRGPSKAKSVKPKAKTPTDPEREAVEGARAITSGQPFEIKVSSSEAKLYDGGVVVCEESSAGSDCPPIEIPQDHNVDVTDTGGGPPIAVVSIVEFKEYCYGQNEKLELYVYQLQDRRDLITQELNDDAVFFTQEDKNKLNEYIKKIDESAVEALRVLEKSEQVCSVSKERYEEEIIKYEQEVATYREKFKAGENPYEYIEANAGFAIPIYYAMMEAPAITPQQILVKGSILIAGAATLFVISQITFDEAEFQAHLDAIGVIKPQLNLTQSVVLTTSALLVLKNLAEQIPDVQIEFPPIEIDVEAANEDEYPLPLDPANEDTEDKEKKPEPPPQPPKEPQKPEEPDSFLEKFLRALERIISNADEIADLISELGSANAPESDKNEDEEEENEGSCRIISCNLFGIVHTGTDLFEEITDESCSMLKFKDNLSEGSIVEPYQEVIFGTEESRQSFYNVTVYSGKTISAENKYKGSIHTDTFKDQPRPLKNDDPDHWLNCKAEDSSHLEDTNTCPQNAERMQDSECQIEGNTSCVAPETNCNGDESSQYPESCRRTEHNHNNAQYPLDPSAPRMEGIYPQIYKKFEGNPYDNRDPKPSDVVQGVISDCPLMAVLMSFAQYNNGAILYDILPNTDGPEFTVNLLMFDKGNLVNKYKIPVDAYLVVDPETGERLYATVELDQSGNKIKDTPLWPALIEKAVAKNLGGDFEQLNWGRGSEFYMEMMLDKLPSVYRFPDDILEFEMFLNNRKNDSPLTLTARKDLVRGNNFQLTADHVYYLNSFVDGELELRNPWGIDHPPSIKVEKLANAFDRASTINPK